MIMNEKQINETINPADQIVIFRCGWCGWPCNKDGSCIEMDNDEANDYLKEHKESKTELVNGACCPNGN